MNVFQSIYKPILTCGYETWSLTQQQQNKIQAVNEVSKKGERCNKNGQS